MNQKRFLTADEIFQLFGVDAEALEQLVQSGEVEALRDRASFRYRAEDFAKLVNEGRLSPRTAGEMFEVDSSGEIPFLKIKSDDQPPRYDDGVSFIELDEDALNEQAQKDQPSQTPVVPDKWFESDDSIEMQTITDDPSDEIPAQEPTKHGRETTDFDYMTDEDSVDLDEFSHESNASDSDVRLEGPVSLPMTAQPGAQPRKSETDSDVRLSYNPGIEEPSDSDVSIAPEAHAAKPDSDSDVTLKPDSDSDVHLAEPAGSESGGLVAAANEPGHGKSDSDVVLASEAEQGRAYSPSAHGPSDSDVVLVSPAGYDESGSQKKDSDSDVRIAGADMESSTVHAGDYAAATISDSAVLSESDVAVTDESGSGIRLGSGDSGVQPQGGSSLKLSMDDLSMLEDASSGEVPADMGADKTDSDIPIAVTDEVPSHEPETVDSGISLEADEPDSGISLQDAQTDNEIKIDGNIWESPMEQDSGITWDSSGVELGIAAEAPKTDSEINIIDEDSDIARDDEEPDSGISLDSAVPDSGLALQASKTEGEIHLDDLDSGLALDAPDSGLNLGADSGIRLSSDKTDADLAIASDSGIMLDGRADSGLALHGGSDVFSGDSGIRLGTEDSGLAIEGESSLKLGAGDSGIRLDEGTESGFSLQDDGEDDAASTMSEIEATILEPKLGADHTQALDVVESGEFEIPMDEGDHTVEMAFGDDSEDELSEHAATMVNKGRGKKGGLSDSFEVDDSLEVEELDISEDLDGAVDEDEEVEEFAEAEDEVLDADDTDFSDNELDEAEEGSESEVSVPAAKARVLPKEPSWSMLAVLPIGAASLAMAATVLVLWGGVATMWTGAEAPGPAAALISTLAGMSPW